MLQCSPIWNIFSLSWCSYQTASLTVSSSVPSPIMRVFEMLWLGKDWFLCHCQSRTHHGCPTQQKFALPRSSRSSSFQIRLVTRPSWRRVVRYPPIEIILFSIASQNTFCSYHSKNPAVCCIVPCASFRSWDNYDKVISWCRTDCCRRCHLYPFLLHFYHCPLFSGSILLDWDFCHRCFLPVLLIVWRVTFVPFIFVELLVWGWLNDQEYFSIHS